MNLNTSLVPQLASANVFTNNQTIDGTTTGFGLTVAGGTYEGILLTGPEAFIGAGLEIETTGTNGMYWQMLNTGATSAQGINKLNFRNDSTGLDVLTLLPNGQVGIGTTAPNNLGGWLGVTPPPSGGTNMNGIVAKGASPTGEAAGGSGIVGTGGTGAAQDGDGGFFTGGNSSSFGDGLQAIAGSGGIAANFKGNVTITGNLMAGSKNFKIDHPLDPANKYLVHASIESSEMMNIYTGNVTTDAQGKPRATARLVRGAQHGLPLSVDGDRPVRAGHLSGEDQNHEFQIRTSVPNVKVSWQITGVRQDAYAKAHPIVVEEEKDARLRGFYLHPELYGAAAERQIEWARHPQMMKQLQEHK